MTRQRLDRIEERRNRRKIINEIVKEAIETTPEGGNVIEHARRIGKERYGNLGTFLLIMKLVVEILQALYAEDDNLTTDID